MNFAFVYFDPTTFQITPMDTGDTALYSQFTALKTKKPSLQTWVSVGGWSFNDATNTPNTQKAFSDMASSVANRVALITSLTQFMTTYGFDGVDIDWEYPGASDRGGVKADTANFVTLLQELRASFGTKYGISATLPSSYW
jgi:chitinase